MDFKKQVIALDFSTSAYNCSFNATKNDRAMNIPDDKIPDMIPVTALEKKGGDGMRQY